MDRLVPQADDSGPDQRVGDNALHLFRFNPSTNIFVCQRKTENEIVRLARLEMFQQVSLSK